MKVTATFGSKLYYKFRYLIKYKKMYLHSDGLNTGHVLLRYDT